MPDTVFGLPTHAIVVHATVVFLPLAALAVLLHAFWPAARRRLGGVTRWSPASRWCWFRWPPRAARAWSTR